MAVWPIGMVVIFAALLAPCRQRLVDESKSSPLICATAFLHRDYKAPFFWWEVASLLQRTTLTGWLLLFGSDLQFIRLLAALVVSVAFLVALLICYPYKKKLDYGMAAGCQLLFVRRSDSNRSGRGDVVTDANNVHVSVCDHNRFASSSAALLFVFSRT